jgi:hypothetical protein
MSGQAAIADSPRRKEATMTDSIEKACREWWNAHDYHQSPEQSVQTITALVREQVEKAMCNCNPIECKCHRCTAYQLSLEARIAALEALASKPRGAFSELMLELKAEAQKKLLHHDLIVRYEVNLEEFQPVGAESDETWMCELVDIEEVVVVRGRGCSGEQALRRLLAAVRELP